MLEPGHCLEVLRKHGIDFFCGIPDSLLKDLLLEFDKQLGAESHVITANEGSAVALAAGYHLATEKPALVYMQNSGLGNAVNPLMSLAHQSVYSVPMLLLIGHRGKPGVHDEPQHQAMGVATEALLDALDVPCFSLDAESPLEEIISQAHALCVMGNRPVAVLVAPKTFAASASSNKSLATSAYAHTLTRYLVIEQLLDYLSPEDVLVATTGFTGRELDKAAKERGLSCDNFFLNVGAMGHANQIALGLKSFCDRRVFTLDGDGAVAMHLGNLALIGKRRPAHFFHFVIRNGLHESVGGQATCLDESVELGQVALALGYAQAHKISNQEALTAVLDDLFTGEGATIEGPVLLEVLVAPGVAENLGRPDNNFIAAKERLQISLLSGA
jgi:phosphonopyruvate decarboxylase